MMTSMNLIKFLSLSLLCILLLEISPLAQSNQNVCTKTKGPEIWIKRKNEDRYFENDGRKFVEIRDGKLFYCVADVLSFEDMSRVQEIRFEKPKTETIKPLSSSSNNSSAPAILDDVATIPAVINSAQSFPHPSLSGVVILRVLLFESGAIGDVEVVESTEPKLNGIAKENAKELKFTPAIKGGQFVNSKKDVALVFSSASSGSISTSTNPVNSSVRARTVNLQPLKLLKPDSGALVARREVLLEWESVPDVITYRIQAQCSYSYADCHNSERLSATQTSYTLKFLGEGPVRWRVVAERKDGTDLKSGWGFFGYKK